MSDSAALARLGILNSNAPLADPVKTHFQGPKSDLTSAVVTGAAGFIGSHLVERLLASGVHVTGIDSLPADKPRAAENLRDCFSDSRFRFVQGDLRSLSVEPHLAGCDVVFHLAALAGVRLSWGEQFEDYLMANVLGTHRVLRACEQAGVPHLVLASSSSVYGGIGSEPSKEVDATWPTSPYGVSKLAAEQLALTFAQHPETSTRVIALRYFSVYGPRQRPDMLIGRAFQAALTGRPISVFGAGCQTRDFTFVDDVVAATVASARHPGTAEVVNVGTGRPRRVCDVLSIAEELTGKVIVVDRQPPSAGDVEGTWADTAKASRLLGEHPSTELEAGMTAHWEWIKSGSQLRGSLARPARRLAPDVARPVAASGHAPVAEVTL